jgi:ABC-type transport system involved in multi-copper enzyme maturation permease subunit
MSLLRAPSTWLRLTFRWSNSVQSWHERAGDFTVLAGIAVAAAVLALQGFGVIDLEWWQLALACLVPLAPALITNRMGWLKVFGPVLYYDMVRTGRRGRFIFLRMCYSGLLVLMLCLVVLGQTNLFRFRTDSNTAAVIAELYFTYFIIAQFVTVVLLTPAYVGGAISEEKDRKTLEFMLATDLLNREIVLSKLGSRLANLFLFVLTGLPILSILQFLGGVDPNLVVAGYVVTAMTVFGQSGVAILCSVTTRKPRESIALSYLAVVLYYVIWLALFITGMTPYGASLYATPIWFGDDPPTVASLVKLYNAGSLVDVIQAVTGAGARGRLALELPTIVRNYTLFHLALGVGATGLAVARLRRVALAQMYGKPIKAGGRLQLWRRPTVGALPMLWKEVHCEGRGRANWIAWVIFTILLAATFVPAGLIVKNSLEQFHRAVHRYDYLGTYMMLWCRVCTVVVGSLTVLGVAVRASTAVTSERDRQTLDTLLTTPLDSSSMLHAKWVGSMLSARFAFVWLATIWATAIITGGLHWAALPLVIAALLVQCSFAATLGLWFSVISKSSMRATVLTILTVLGLGLGHWLAWICCLPVMAASNSHRLADRLARFQFGVLTPPFQLGFLAFPEDELRELSRHRAYGPDDNLWLEFLCYCLLGLLVWTIATAVLYGFTSMRWRWLTNREERMRPDGRGGTRIAPVRRARVGAMGPMGVVALEGDEEEEIEVEVVDAVEPVIHDDLEPPPRTPEAR